MGVVLGSVPVLNRRHNIDSAPVFQVTVRRMISLRAVGLAVAATALLLPTRASAAITVTRGDVTVGRISVPAGVKVVGRSFAHPGTAGGEPDRVVLAWTVRSGRPKTKRTWRTYVTWCDTACDRPVRLSTWRSRSSTPWSVLLSVDGDRAFVRFGRPISPRWALATRGHGVAASGRAASWGVGGQASIATTPDGTVWGASTMTDQRVFLQPLTQGAYFKATATNVLASPADSVSLHAFGTGLAATWDERSDAADGEIGSVIWSSGATLAELQDAGRHVQLSAKGSPASISGPDGTQVLVTWVDDQGHGAGAVNHARALWVVAGTSAAPATASDFGALPGASAFDGWDVDLFQAADGSVALCPGNLVAPAPGVPLSEGPTPACPADWSA